MGDGKDTALMLEMLEVRQQALNVLTIFSDNCTVRFCHPDGKVEEKRGQWCTVCKWETIGITEVNTYQNSKGTMKPISRNTGNGRHSMSDLICCAASISVATIHCTRSIVPSRAWRSTTTLYPEQLPEKGSKPSRKWKRDNGLWMVCFARHPSPMSFQEMLSWRQWLSLWFVMIRCELLFVATSYKLY